jgi:predicted DNA-binding protein (UPF0251 family)
MTKAKRPSAGKVEISNMSPDRSRWSIPYGSDEAEVIRLGDPADVDRHAPGDAGSPIQLVTHAVWAKVMASPSAAKFVRALVKKGEITVSGANVL